MLDGLTAAEGKSLEALLDKLLVRHMTQMEHVWLSWALVEATKLSDTAMTTTPVAPSRPSRTTFAWYFEEVALSNAAIAEMVSLDAAGAGHGRTLRAVLVKMIGEYAIHAGQAHMLRFAALGEMIR